MRKLILRTLVTAFALYVAVQLVPGISYEGGWPMLVAAALISGFVNAVVRPILGLLTCPLIVLTMGLFILVLNGLMLLLAAWLADLLGVAFFVDGFRAAFWGALVVSVVSFLVNLFLGDRDDDWR